MVGTVKYAVNVPNFGDYGYPTILADLASDAETAGWDGFFIWDHISGPTEWRVPMGDAMVPIAHAPYVDPCVALSAIATRTENIRLGALVTAVARRRPWKLARETVSLDHLSKGRLVVRVGLGGTHTEFAGFGEDADPVVRSRKLDEGLDVLTGLWTGKPFNYSGDYYTVEETVFRPPPIQSPRIPLWVACFWPNKKPLRRAARYDGVVPGVADWTKKLTPDDVKQVVTYIARRRRDPRPFDVVIGGQTPAMPKRAATVVQPYIAAGAT
jgi:alkanesulfonate monooxygenase SsuD/methylene tetrahydromethanopterin reductase-like flavin-dependent oxidoreductase (luciferase family)